ncbi:hypothetical protein SDC9_99748 [bioreactor metagenome]|uniref:Uncharacterized protein n=1 Tax=bioreactor metagenome TaxID=1076179 RepID=A0A645ATT4_9ZZZZ
MSSLNCIDTTCLSFVIKLFFSPVYKTFAITGLLLFFSFFSLALDFDKFFILFVLDACCLFVEIVLFCLLEFVFLFLFVDELEFLSVEVPFVFEL